jgi:hypothetical protein
MAVKLWRTARGSINFCSVFFCPLHVLLCSRSLRDVPVPPLARRASRRSSGTDFYQEYDIGNIRNWINVSAVQDWIAGTVSDENPKHELWAKNLVLKAPSGYGDGTSHSASWNSDQLRSQWWAYWQQQAACHEWFDSSTNTVHGRP